MDTKILIVEDDQDLGMMVHGHLQNEGYCCQWCGTGVGAVSLATKWRPDVILLDLILPDLDGFSVLGRVRGTCAAPIIMVTGLRGEQDRVRGLTSGADDYVVKPFGLDELRARIGSVMRRHGLKQPEAGVATLRAADLEVDTAAHRAWVRSQEVYLTPMEFRLLVYFLQHRGRLLTKTEILRAVWGPEYGDDWSLLRVVVQTLRHKIDAPAASGGPRHAHIDTVRGEGYRFS